MPASQTRRGLSPGAGARAVRSERRGRRDWRRERGGSSGWRSPARTLVRASRPTARLTHEEIETGRGEVTPCGSDGTPRRRALASAVRGGGAEDWEARRWGHAERVQVEERVSGRKKAKTSEAPGELGVEVSAKGHRIAHSSPPTFCGSLAHHLYCPGEKLQGLLW